MFPSSACNAAPRALPRTSTPRRPALRRPRPWLITASGLLLSLGLNACAWRNGPTAAPAGTPIVDTPAAAPSASTSSTSTKIPTAARPAAGITATAFWKQVNSSPVPRPAGGGRAAAGLHPTPAAQPPRTGGGSPPEPVLPPARYANAGAPAMALQIAPHLPATGGLAQATAAAANADEAYGSLWDNPFQAVADAPLSTFAIDVDSASYSNVRRFLTAGQRPPIDAVRIEELINYFPYQDPLPEAGGSPVRVNLELSDAPWQPEHRLLRVNLTTAPIAFDHRPLSNLVFLIDVSGSMQDANKLPLVKQALRLLTEQLGEADRVAMVVYAGSSGLVLPSVSGLKQPRILAAIDQLEAGGSTHGSEGIALAYETALASFIPGGANRVILATDGDFNVGITDPANLETLIRDKAKSGVFLTVLGFGMGNLKDETLERLADRGNGHYAYIDSMAEARKVLVEEIGGTLVTVAKDVKLQLEFNPSKVSGYRLLGYENRLLAAADFNDDSKDGGEIGAGHRISALYELVPAGRAVPTALATPQLPPTLTPLEQASATPVPSGSASPTPAVDPLRYVGADPAFEGELLTVKLRYKLPDAAESQRLNVALGLDVQPLAAASDNLRFAAAVAEFGMLLRGSPHRGAAAFADLRSLAAGALGEDPGGHRAGFLALVDLAAKAAVIAP